MVIEIKMCRFDNVPWGFRLVGGTDFEFPLTVVKVTEGSIAEEAGLRADDVIVRINDTATSPLTHDEVNNIIRHCGNVFYLGVYRDVEIDIKEAEGEAATERETETETETGVNVEQQMPTCQRFPMLGLDNRHTPDSFLDVSSSCKSPISRTYSEDRDYITELPDRPCSALSENMEIKLVEDEIAAVLSGESEVLKEHNVMGILPKPGVCMTSDVLRTLNEEAIKTKAEMDKENRKWTTFLQKPNRPIPKSKAQLEAERRALNAYKVKIVKSKPRSSVSPSVEPKPITTQEQAAEILETQKPDNKIEDGNVKECEEKVEILEDTNEIATEKEEEIINEPDTPLPTDTEVPNLEEISIPNTPTKTTVAIEQVEEVGEQHKSPNDEEIISAQLNEIENESEGVGVGENTSETNNIKENVEEIAPATQSIQKTEEELALESQLADVQRQLAALSSLPSTIQSTLDAVTKQLADLLPAFKLQQVTIGNGAETRSLQLEQIDESNEEANQAAEQSEQQIEEKAPNIDHDDDDDDDEDRISTALSLNGNANDAIDQEVEDINVVNKEVQQQRIQQQQPPQCTDQQKVKKEKKLEVIEELEEHLQRKTNPKRSKRAFGPLTPSSERPLVLPGGRRWYRPKDAYNDEFIAEVLSSQAELITGTTLGSSYESPYLGYDTRVNFMKYQKPEKKIDLNRSEVYKVIHHLDRQPVRGIEIRPPVVPAEADIRKAVQS